MLFLSRLIQGLTSASLTTGIYMMIVEGLSESKVGVALDLVGSAGYLGMLTASSFMGFMISFANWRFAFLILIIFIVIQLVLLQKISFKETSDKSDIDLRGSLLFFLIMVLLTFGLESIDEYGLILVIISVIISILFFYHEKRVKNPIYNVKLLTNVNYSIGNYAAMATNFSVTIAVTALSFHLIYILGITEYVVGLILIISPVIMVVMAPLAGNFSNKIDSRIISGISLVLIFVSMLIYAFMYYLPFEMIILACILQGLGTGMFSAPNNKFVLLMVDEKSLPDATSFLATSKEFGKIVSMSIFSVILSVLIGNQALGLKHLNKLLFQSINIMMIICALISLFAALLLFYSKYKYKLEINRDVLNLFYKLMPERIKKFYK